MTTATLGITSEFATCKFCGTDHVSGFNGCPVHPNFGDKRPIRQSAALDTSAAGYLIDGPEEDTGVMVDTLEKARAELITRGVAPERLDRIAGLTEPDAYIGHEIEIPSGVVFIEGAEIMGQPITLMPVFDVSAITEDRITRAAALKPSTRTKMVAEVRAAADAYGAALDTAELCESCYGPDDSRTLAAREICESLGATLHRRNRILSGKPRGG